MKNEKKLRLVTLTINNICNLNCPHCYLQLKEFPTYVDNTIISKILKSNFEHIAVVGQEPLVDTKSINLLQELAMRVKEKGKTISLITNGKNIDKIDNQLFNNLDFIDISFDGGKKIYNNIRNYSFEKLKTDIQILFYSKGYKNINALHTLHNKNWDEIDDLLSVTEIIPFQIIMFSPYLETNNFGQNKVNKIDLKELIKKLSSNRKFMETKETILNIDMFHLEQANISSKEFKTLIIKNKFQNKIILHDKDLINEGVIRVTHSGLILTPKQSLNPKEYSKGLQIKNFKNINEALKILSISN